MSKFKETTQRGATYIYECPCGEHILRVAKDDDTICTVHSLQFFGYQADTRVWSRIKQAWKILMGNPHVDADILIYPSTARELGDAILELADAPPSDEFKAKVKETIDRLGVSNGNRPQTPDEPPDEILEQMLEGLE